MFVTLNMDIFPELKRLEEKKTDVESYSDFNYSLLYNLSLKKLHYLFSFYIYKVDKQIYKNTRGKSGKYTFVWKYIAPYKRHALIAHWLMKEVKITPGQKLKERVNAVINKFILQTEQTWI